MSTASTNFSPPEGLRASQDLNPIKIPEGNPKGQPDCSESVAAATAQEAEAFDAPALAAIQNVAEKAATDLEGAAQAADVTAQAAEDVDDAKKEAADKTKEAMDGEEEAKDAADKKAEKAKDEADSEAKKTEDAAAADAKKASSDEEAAVDKVVDTPATAAAAAATADTAATPLPVATEEPKEAKVHEETVESVAKTDLDNDPTSKKGAEASGGDGPGGKDSLSYYITGNLKETMRIPVLFAMNIIVMKNAFDGLLHQNVSLLLIGVATYLLFTECFSKLAHKVQQYREMQRRPTVATPVSTALQSSGSEAAPVGETDAGGKKEEEEVVSGDAPMEAVAKEVVEAEKEPTPAPANASASTAPAPARCAKNWADMEMEEQEERMRLCT